MDEQDALNQYREQYSYYAKKLLTDLGLGDLAQPERGQLLAAIEQLIGKIMTNTLLENLAEEQMTEAEGILNRGGNQEDVVMHFLSTTPDIQTKMIEALTEAYARMLNEANQLTVALGYKAKNDQNSDQSGSNLSDTAPSGDVSEAPITE
jgi:hypothetical protein